MESSECDVKFAECVEPETLVSLLLYSSVLVSSCFIVAATRKKKHKSCYATFAALASKPNS